jgi:protoheme IX farnesyltransferase
MSAGVPLDLELAATRAASDAPPSAQASSAGFVSTVTDLVALTKPRVTVMVVATALGGAWLAARRAGATPTSTVLLALVGTAVIVGGANALNMYLERDTDALMVRTRNRPLPSGRMAPGVALAVGLMLSAVSLPLLTFAVNAATGLLAAIALVSYVLLYTPLKRRTSTALLVGAVPGAMPPLIGWTSVSGAIDVPGLLLFGVLFLWQVPHFLAIATFRQTDYARAGMMVLPVERGERVTRRHIVAYTVALIVVTLLLAQVGVGGPAYLPSAVILGAAFLAFGAWGLRPGTGARWARGLFFGSMVYLVLLLTALMAGA